MKSWLAGVCWRWWLRLEDAGGIERMIRVWHYDIENRDGENTLWAIKKRQKFLDTCPEVMTEPQP